MKKKCVVAESVICGVILLFVGTGLVEATAISGASRHLDRDLVEVIDQQQTQGCGYGFGFYNENWVAQGFVPRIASLTKVDVFLFKAGAPPDNVQITLYIRDLLDGNTLTSCSVDASGISGVGDWIEFNFSDIEVNIGWEYYIICRADGGSSSNCYNWLFGVNDPYPVGDAWYSSNAGFAWSMLNPDGYPHPDCCFKTYGLEQPPTTPVVTGPATGKIGQPTRYTFNSTDSDGRFVYYLIDWGDGQTTGWTGENGSGDPVWIDHTWEKKGTYTIKAKARDKQNAESDWGALEIKMPASYNLPRQGVLDRLLERFPNAFPVLRHLLGY